MKTRLSILSLIVLILLVGCSRKELKVPLEDIGMVDSMAFDYIDENEMRLTVAIPQYFQRQSRIRKIFPLRQI